MRWLAILIVSLITPVLVNAEPYPYGIYSNVSMLTGEPSGVEILVLNNGAPQCEVSVLLQVFEGWPEKPELLRCCECWSDNITFESSYRGPFQGKIVGETLIGQFLENEIEISLPKGESFWQR